MGAPRRHAACRGDTVEDERDAMRYRLLAGIPAEASLSLAAHREIHGETPRLGRSDGDALIRQVAAAGLTGRGGGGFPTATKMAIVAEGSRPVVVVNGTEGEPMSAKDRVLLGMTPHLVLDGAEIAAQAVGARECLLVAPAAQLPGLHAALRERRSLPRSGTRVKLKEAATGFVAGEETAVLAHLEGRPPRPRLVPPRPAERGYRGRPTLVNNVETLAHIALIARHGSDWFTGVGTPARPGTTLVTVSGPVRAPGVFEVPSGIPIPKLLEIAGGATEQVRALLVGGYSGAWVEGSGQELALEDASLRTAGAIAGAGVVVALGMSDCPVAETARLASWLSAESAGQCGPCVYGLDSLSELLERTAGGRRVTGDRERLARWTGMVSGRGACQHPTGAARMIASAARVFAAEFEDHARHGRCDACAWSRVLITPGRRDSRAA
jgi:NADH:ubiquinone oxidoreductase subunit F (NADH-binding)